MKRVTILASCAFLVYESIDKTSRKILNSLLHAAIVEICLHIDHTTIGSMLSRSRSLNKKGGDGKVIPRLRIIEFAHCIRIALTIRKAKPRKSRSTKKQIQSDYIQLDLPFTD